MQQTLSANRAGMKFNVCERLLPPRPLLFHTIPDSLSWLSLLHRALRDDTKNGHIELIRFKEYYRMPREHEHISFVFSSAFPDIFS